MFSVSSVQSTQPVITEPLGPVFIILRARTGEFKLNLRCWAELKLYELRGKNYFKCIIGPAHTIAIFFHKLSYKLWLCYWSNKREVG